MALFNLPLLVDKRNEKGWSQANLASSAGVGIATVQRAEKAGAVSRLTAYKLAKALDCHWEDLTQPPLF